MPSTGGPALGDRGRTQWPGNHGNRPPALVRASGGPRYAIALAVDALGTGLLRPFLLLYGVDVLRLPGPDRRPGHDGGVAAGLCGTPAMGRWLDRGARSTAVAASMLVRVLGMALLLIAPAASTGTVWQFAVPRCSSASATRPCRSAHAALVATVSAGRERDAALAGGRSVRNAGLGLGALSPPPASPGHHRLRALAAGTGLQLPRRGGPRLVRPRPRRRQPSPPRPRRGPRRGPPSPGCACCSPRTSATCSASMFRRSRFPGPGDAVHASPVWAAGSS